MTNMSITMTTTGGDVLILFKTTTSHSTNLEQSEYALYVDSSQTFVTALSGHNGGDMVDANISFLVTGLSSASHTFEIRWRSGASGNTVSQSAATWGMDRSLVAMEIN